MRIQKVLSRNHETFVFLGAGPLTRDSGKRPLTNCNVGATRTNMAKDKTLSVHGKPMRLNIGDNTRGKTKPPTAVPRYEIIHERVIRGDNILACKNDSIGKPTPDNEPF